MFGNSLSKVEKLIEKKKDAELAKLAESKDEKVRLAAIVGLGKIRGEASYNALVALLRSTEAAIRAAAVNAIAEYGDSKLRAHLEHLLKSEADAGVIAALHNALAKVKGNN